MAPSKVVSLKSKGKSSSSSNKGSKSEEQRTTIKCLQEWSTWALKKAKVITHYGFVPMVIIIGICICFPVILGVKYPAWPRLKPILSISVDFVCRPSC